MKGGAEIYLAPPEQMLAVGGPLVTGDGTRGGEFNQWGGRKGGFEAGVDVGLAPRRWPDSGVFRLNPDAGISRDDVPRLHCALLAEPDLASMGPAQVDADSQPISRARNSDTSGSATARRCGRSANVANCGRHVRASMKAENARAH